MMVFTGLGMIAMTRTDTSHSVLLAYSTPLWSVLISWLMLRRVPSRWQFAAIGVGISGIALIVSPFELDWNVPGLAQGAALLIIAAICWSVVIIHVRHHRWDSTPLSLAPWQMLIATVPLTIWAYSVHGAPVDIELSPRLLGLLIFIGPIATSACFVISSEYGRRISSFAMSNFTLGVPLLGVAFSVMFLGNHLSAVFLAGLTLVVAGMILAGFAAQSMNNAR
jgi:drug/metabolite transporter (DMT)-like permease